ncbi:MAG TPA: hypothetical protein VI795_03020 [Patescibacteria group bacterium]|nr:hypothetical protein [Patescibacteria group bacterium]
MYENEYWALLRSEGDVSKAKLNSRAIESVSPVSGIVKVYIGHGWAERNTSRQLTRNEDLDLIMGELKKRKVVPLGIISSN